MKKDEKKEDPVVAEKAEGSALKTAVEAGTGTAAITLGWLVLIAAALNSKAAEIFFGKLVDVLTNAKGLALGLKDLSIVKIQNAWDKIQRWVRLGGFGSIMLLILAAIFAGIGWPVAATWVVLFLGGLYYLISWLIYGALAPLAAVEEDLGKKWQSALSRPFQVLALLVVILALSVLALPDPLKDVRIFTLFAGLTLLLLSRSALSGKKSDAILLRAVVVIVVLVAWTVAMFTFPTLNRWVDARAEQASRIIGLDSEKAEDMYQTYKVVVAGNLLDEEDKFVDKVGSDLGVGDLVKVDIGKSEGNEKKMKEIEGLGPCRKTFIFDGTKKVADGWFPLKYMQMHAELVTAPPPPPPPSARSLRASIPTFSFPELPKKSPEDKPKNSGSDLAASIGGEDEWNDWNDLVGNEWVDTGLIVYPTDRVTWGPFMGKMADAVIGEGGKFRFEFCQGMKIPDGNGGWEYVNSEHISVPTVRGGADMYFARTNFKQNPNGYPMLVRYTGSENFRIDLDLRLERNVVNPQKGG